jgi:membrane protein YqaA with SNARE-associated domain
MLLRRLYDWTLSLAARPTAELWLAVIACIESSIFLVPADVLFIPMVLSRPSRAYRYALTATVASVIGGILGYAIGSLAFESIARPVLSFYGKLEQFEAMKSCVSSDTLLVLLTTSGLAHMPPIKIVTILAGVLQVSFVFFLLSCIVARGARFFALAYLLKRYGPAIQSFIEKRLGLIAGLIAAALVALYLLVKFLGSSGSLSC